MTAGELVQELPKTLEGNKIPQKPEYFRLRKENQKGVTYKFAILRYRIVALSFLQKKKFKLERYEYTEK